jgi:AcrR family transcriptional regulator
MSSPDVSAHVRRLWRHRGTTLPTPRRGPRQQLDLDEILDAAIALADADGLAAVSTRAVAARFGKTAMALYPYVGTKEQLVALMQDHAGALPSWADPASGLAGGLEAWALAFFDLHLAHPWLAGLSWSRAAPGPNERDWLERLLGILDHWQVAAGSRSPVVTMLYATVRSCAETAAAHRRTSGPAAARWLEEVEATYRLVPSLATHYPLATSLPQVAADWRDAPRAGLLASVRLLSESLCE